MNESLKENHIDKIAALTKGIVGSIPFGGSVISEIVGMLIPNQRIDRLAKYIQVLEDKFKLIPIDLLKMKHGQKMIQRPSICFKNPQGQYGNYNPGKEGGEESNGLNAFAKPFGADFIQSDGAEYCKKVIGGDKQ